MEYIEHPCATITEYPNGETTCERGVDRIYLHRRPGVIYDDQEALSKLYAERKEAYREGVDNPFFPVVCMGCDNLFTLFIAYLSSSTHYLAYGRLDREQSGGDVIGLMPSYGQDSIFSNVHNFTLSGKSRRFKWFCQRLFFFRNLVLPLNEVCAGTAKVNIRMLVDGKEQIENCPILRMPCERKDILSLT